MDKLFDLLGGEGRGVELWKILEKYFLQLPKARKKNARKALILAQISSNLAASLSKIWQD